MKYGVHWKAVGVVAAAATAFGGLAVSEAEAASEFTLPFEQIPEDGQLSLPDIAEQLSVTVFQSDEMETDGRIGFTFANEGDIESTINQVHFDDRLGLLANGEFTDASERTPNGQAGEPIQYDPLNNPQLPRGGELDPPFDSTFAWGAEPPPSFRGVRLGEWATFEFDLADSSSFEDVENALPGPDLRIGLHMISIGEEEFSASFIAVPTPGAGLAGLVLLGTIGAAGAARRRFASAS